MNKIKLEIVGLSFSQTQSGAYALILNESEGNRRLPIIIGNFEAQAIAVMLENMVPTRPLTHDLFKSFADAFLIDVIEVIIYNLKEGIFYAKMVCTDGNQTIEIDARTSDAVAMAVRFNCPIYTFENILMQAGVTLDERDEPLPEIKTPLKPVETKKPVINMNEFSGLSASQLQEMLAKALDDEAYERASRIRDELKKRKK
ncbi:MAG: bifunctional nuclease family protein [Bacteroidia bacterium]|nr:bifunctional nuclease family protein [Bacteroidia bacterium]